MQGQRESERLDTRYERLGSQANGLKKKGSLPSDSSGCCHASRILEPIAAQWHVLLDGATQARPANYRISKAVMAAMQVC